MVIFSSKKEERKKGGGQAERKCGTEEEGEGRVKGKGRRGKGQMGERKEENSSFHTVSPFSYDHTLFLLPF